MKAMILAAGHGSRLQPYTASRPKPLFSLGGRPVLDLAIRNLQRAGCRTVIVNTHHLHGQIENFLARQTYAIPVTTRHEPEILGTGGAIKNMADAVGDAPFMAINADIVTDIDLGRVYAFHLNHTSPVTLVLHDFPQFNQVAVDDDGFVRGFHARVFPPSPGAVCRKLAFTGIQVLDPEVLDIIPGGFASIIDVYLDMLAAGRSIRALVVANHRWADIGTPQAYQAAVLEYMAPRAFQIAFPDWSGEAIQTVPLQGDGSDRIWHRLTSGDHRLITVDHGIRPSPLVSEADAFVAIGDHLRRRGLPLPQIFLHDTFAGRIFLEDLGDVHLQTHVRQLADDRARRTCYGDVIETLIDLSLRGAEGFDPSWTYQTPAYDKNLILERECGYFVDAFVKDYLGLPVEDGPLADDFERLAEAALDSAVEGFLHRDFQSRNILVKDRRFFLIDFQGGRLGPLQYDLASLLIDPYVDLPFGLREQLLEDCETRLAGRIRINRRRFRTGFRCCAVTRNLQVLGAFGFLSRRRGKPAFVRYIPAAVHSLKYNLGRIEALGLRHLRKLVNLL